MNSNSHPISSLDTPSSELRATLKLRALIADLRSRIEILDIDIRNEEERTSVFDAAHVAYPILAQTLRTRRDNLLTTIRMLESRLAETEMAA
jgi:hypothetical protein